MHFFLWQQVGWNGQQKCCSGSRSRLEITISTLGTQLCHCSICPALTLLFHINMTIQISGTFIKIVIFWIDEIAVFNTISILKYLYCNWIITFKYKLQVYAIVKDFVTLNQHNQIVYPNASENIEFANGRNKWGSKCLLFCSKVITVMCLRLLFSSNLERCLWQLSIIQVQIFVSIFLPSLGVVYWMWLLLYCWSTLREDFC